MRECPDTDAVVTIGVALNWDVAAGLSHLQTCADCRARIEALQLTRAALAATETVDEATLTRISAALHAAAQSERARAQATERWVNVLETVLAGIAAPVVLISSGIPVQSLVALLLTGALGAAFLMLGKKLRLDAI